MSSFFHFQARVAESVQPLAIGLVGSTKPPSVVPSIERRAVGAGVSDAAGVCATAGAAIDTAAASEVVASRQTVCRRSGKCGTGRRIPKAGRPRRSGNYDRQPTGAAICGPISRRRANSAASPTAMPATHAASVCRPITTSQLAATIAFHRLP